jgi:hypothetical protein
MDVRSLSAMLQRAYIGRFVVPVQHNELFVRHAACLASAASALANLKTGYLLEHSLRSARYLLSAGCCSREQSDRT